MTVVSQSPPPQDVESLFHTKPISKIRNIESATRNQIRDKASELRQLIGNRYRDVIDSADSIVDMTSSSRSISNNISGIHDGILNSLSLTTTNDNSYNSVSIDIPRVCIYDIACRIKYIIDTPENIWGCIDEYMYLDAATRFTRAKLVYNCLTENKNSKSVLCKFPLLQHHWQTVEGLKSVVSQRSRDRLDQPLGVRIEDLGNTLAAVAVVDGLDPCKVLRMYLDVRKCSVFGKLGGCKAVGEDVVNMFCEVVKVIEVSIAQVGELFMYVLSDMPLFYRTVLGLSPACQLFSGIPDADEEARLWEAFRDDLKSRMAMLDRDYITKVCSDWLRNCGEEIVDKVRGRLLIDAIDSGEQLAKAEKLIRETMDGKEVLKGSLEWLESVYGSEIEKPWSRTCELVLGDDVDLWDEFLEEVFTSRMKAIIDSGYDGMNNTLNVKTSIQTVMKSSGDQLDFKTYINRSNLGGRNWFKEETCKMSGVALDETNFNSCLDAYFGDEVSRIRKSVDSHCQNVLVDLLSFLESPKASLRLKQLAPYLQRKCSESMLAILAELSNELEGDSASPPAIIVQRSLFIGKILFALQKYSPNIHVILGSPQLWVHKSKTPTQLRYSGALVDFSLERSWKEMKMVDPYRKPSHFVISAFYGVKDIPSPQLEELKRTTQDLLIRAHNLWIIWVSDGLSDIFSHNLRNDDFLSATTPLEGWKQKVVKQEDSADTQSEMRILLPSVPSLYVASYLNQACEEIHRVGGHVLDKPILKLFAARLLEKVIDVYVNFISTEDSVTRVSEKGVLQVLLDLRFAADILSGGDVSENVDTSKMPKTNMAFRRKQDLQETRSVIKKRLDGLVKCLTQRLDPIDWLTYEPYLWKCEKKSYLRHAVLFGFFVRLHRMYTATNKIKHKEPTLSECNIMRLSKVPHFSDPVLSAKGTSKFSTLSSTDDSPSSIDDIPSSIDGIGSSIDDYIPSSVDDTSSSLDDTPSSIDDNPSSVDDVSSRSSKSIYMQEEFPCNLDMDNYSSFRVASPFLKSFMQVGSSLAGLVRD